MGVGLNALLGAEKRVMLSLGWLVPFDCEVEAAAGVDVVAETIVKLRGR